MTNMGLGKSPVFGGLTAPLWLSAVFIIGPLFSSLIIILGFLISSRVSDARNAANRFNGISGGMTVLILLLIVAGIGREAYTGQTVTLGLLWEIICVLALFNLALFFLGLKLFQRETILFQLK